MHNNTFIHHKYEIKFRSCGISIHFLPCRHFFCCRDGKLGLVSEENISLFYNAWTSYIFPSSLSLAINMYRESGFQDWTNDPWTKRQAQKRYRIIDFGSIIKHNNNNNHCTFIVSTQRVKLGCIGGVSLCSSIFFSLFCHHCLRAHIMPLLLPQCILLPSMTVQLRKIRDFYHEGRKVFPQKKDEGT